MSSNIHSLSHTDRQTEREGGEEIEIEMIERERMRIQLS